jgi:hypothetical protein
VLTEAGEPFTNSPTTLSALDRDPSATRTMRTSTPCAAKPLASAALNVASPHGVGG